MHFEKMAESSLEMRATLERVIATYGIPTEEFLPEEIFDGVSPCYLDPVTDAEALDKNERIYPLYHVITDLDLTGYRNSLSADPLEALQKVLEDLKAIQSIPTIPTTNNQADEELPLCLKLQDMSKPTTDNAATSSRTSNSETVLMLPFKGTSEQ
jgi:hypothetical protein